MPYACPRLASSALLLGVTLLSPACMIYGAQLPEEIETDDGSEAGEGDAGSTGEGGQLALITGGNQFGECVGACRWEISFLPTVVQLAATDYGAAQEFGVNYGALTQVGEDQLAALDAELAAAGLIDLYGCPDCDDGGASWVRIDSPVGPTDHLYETGNPPPELADYDSFLQSLISSLRACSETSYVVPDGACEPIT